MPDLGTPFGWLCLTPVAHVRGGCALSGLLSDGMPLVWLHDQKGCAQIGAVTRERTGLIQLLRPSSGDTLLSWLTIRRVVPICGAVKRVRTGFNPRFWDLLPVMCLDSVAEPLVPLSLSTSTVPELCCYG